MAQTWQDVESDPRWGELSFENKTQLRDNFFKGEILPHARSQEDADSMHKKFMSMTEVRSDKNVVKQLGENVYARGQEAIGGGIRAMGESITSGESFPERMKRQVDETKLRNWSGPEMARATLETLKLPLDVIGETIDHAVGSTEIGRGIAKDMSRIGAGMAESGTINREIAGQPGFRRPPSILKEPIQAAKWYGYHLTESMVGDVAPAFLVGFINQKAGLGMLGAKVYGEEYTRSRNEGKTPRQSRDDASIAFISEIAPEAKVFQLTFKAIMKMGNGLRKVGNVTKDIAQVGAAETLSEGFTEVANMMYDKYGMDQENITFEDFQMRMKDAMLMGFGMGAQMRGGVHMLRAAENWVIKQKESKDPFSRFESALKAGSNYDAATGTFRNTDGSEYQEDQEMLQLNKPPHFLVDAEGNVFPNPSYAPEVEQLRLEQNLDDPSMVTPPPAPLGITGPSTGPGGGGGALYGKPNRPPGTGIVLNEETPAPQTQVVDDVRYTEESPRVIPLGTDAEFQQDPADREMTSEERKAIIEQALREAGETNVPTRDDTPEEPEKKDPLTSIVIAKPEVDEQLDGQVIEAEPTDGQKEAGNYNKGHVKVNGLDVTVENPKGSIRRGKDWEVEMVDHYGYVKRTNGNDGDQVDIFLGPDAAYENPNVAIVNQRNAETGEFDEHKILLGYEDGMAKDAYFRNYSKDFDKAGVFAGLSEVSLDEVKEWLKTGDQTKPYGEMESQDEQQISKESSTDGEEVIREQETGAGSERGQADTTAQPEEGQQPPRIDRPTGQPTEGDQVDDTEAATDGGEPSPTVVPAVRDYHMTEWKEKLGIDEEAIEAFGQTGDQQRGEPEIAMTKAQAALGGGVLSHAIEHAGDLSNRASPKHNFDWARDAAAGKAEQVLKALRHKYGFGKEHDENMFSNSKFHKVPLGLYRTRVNTALEAYAAAHRKLPVYNEVQRLGRDAAIALGEQRFDDAANLLEKFLEIANNENSYVEAMRNHSYGQETKTPEPTKTPVPETSLPTPVPTPVPPPTTAPEEISPPVPEPITTPEPKVKEDEPEKGEKEKVKKKADKKPEGKKPKEKSEPKKKKLVTEGVKLRRWWDKARKASGTSGEGIWNTINAKTQRSKVFSPTPGSKASPGVQRYYDAIRSNLYTFSNLLPNMMTGFGLYNNTSRYYGSKLSEQVANLLENPDKGDEAREAFAKAAMDYTKMMEDFADIMTAANSITEAEEMISKYIDTTTFWTNRAISRIEWKDNAPKVEHLNSVNEVTIKRPVDSGNRRRFMSLLVSRAEEKDSGYNNNVTLTNGPMYAIKQMIRDESDVTKKKPMMVRPRLDAIDREFPEPLHDVREGDVTPAQFKKEFGFVKVFFGESVMAGEDQRHLNFVWDSFADLAQRMGLPRKAMGINGKLWLAVGALGNGKAAAHFSPNHPLLDKNDKPTGKVVPVINVTRTRGDGSLAHEWGHAFDYLALRATDDGKAVQQFLLKNLKFKVVSIESIKKFIEDYVNAGYPAERVASFAKYRATGQRSHTAFKRNADQLGKDYWGNEEELIARSWESFIFDTMKGTNTYLVSSWVAESHVTSSHGYRGTPYPEGEERKHFQSIYNAILDGIEFKGGNMTLNLVKFEASLPKEDRAFQSKLDKLLAKIPAQVEKRDLKKAEERKKLIEENQRIRKLQNEKRAEEERKRREIDDKAFQDALDKAEAEKEMERLADEEAKRERSERSEGGDAAGTVDPDAEMTAEDRKAIIDQAIKMAQEEQSEEPSAPHTGMPQDEFDALPEAEKEDLKKSQEELPPKPEPTKEDLKEEVVSELDKANKLMAEAMRKAFPSSRPLSFPPTIDEETYKKIKPIIAAAFDSYVKAGKSFLDLVLHMIREYGAWTAPYADYFAEENRLSANLSKKEPVSVPAPPKVESGLIGLLNAKFDEITDNRKLKSILAEHYGREVTAIEMKMGQEAYEAALVIKAREVVANGRASKKGRFTIFNELLKLHNNQINLNIRSSTSMENQAYSTPIPLAYLASELAGITNDSTVYEPTAGNGALMIGANAKHVTANELNKDRTKNLVDLGYRSVTSNDATSWKPNSSFDATIMNPPFGALPQPTVVDGYQIGAIDHLIATKALEVIKKDGKAVLIIGANMKNSDAIRGPKKVFFNWLYSNYNVIDHFEVDGKLYSKQGASWPVTIITIDGRRSTNDVFTASPQRLDNWREIYEHTANILDANGRRGQPDDTVVSPRDGTAEGQRGTPTAPTDSPTEAGGGTGAGRGGRSGVRSGGRNATGRRDTDGTDNNDTGRTDTANGELKQPEYDGSEEGRGSNAESGATAVVQGNETGGEAGDNRDVLLGSEFQTAYVSRSKGYNDEILVPINMKQALEDALDQLEKNIGMGVDEYVLKKLQYKSLEEMFSSETKITGFMGLQIDAIAAAIYNFEEKGKGMVIADQTGVGKGRQAAAMIRYALLNGMTPVFVTAKENLYTDMYDDLLDIGQTGMEPFIFTNNVGITDRNIATSFRKKKKLLHKMTSGIRNAGFKALERGSMPIGTNMIFMTYSQINRVGNQRNALTGLKESSSIKPMFILDESHLAAGVRESPDGKGGTKLHGAGFMFNLIMEAPVVYLSATFAKAAENMAIYHRTDMFDAVDNIRDLENAIKKGGEALQTVLSHMLTKSLQLFRREKSFAGIDFSTDKYTQDKDDFSKFNVYDSATGFIKRTFKTGVTKSVRVTADEITKGLREIRAMDDMFSDWANDNQAYIIEHLDMMGGEVGYAGTGVSGLAHHPFASIAHNFIRQALVSMKADLVVAEAIRLLDKGEKPVIVVQNTMGSFLDGEIDSKKATLGKKWNGDYRTVQQKALEATRKLSLKDAQGNTVMSKGKPVRLTFPKHLLPPNLQVAYTQAEGLIESLDISEIHPFYIDYIKQKVAAHVMKNGKTVNFGEITGRDYEMDYSEGTPIPRRRKGAQASERRGIIDGFNDGSIDALIMNEAGATGLSIHASQKFKDKRKRTMLVAQAFGNINVMMQMFGRINRTGQIIDPEYIMMGLDLPSEIRPMAVTNAKMRSLNANTSSNVESETTLDAAEIYNKHGDTVVATILSEDNDLARALGITIDVNNNGSVSVPNDIALKATGRLSLLPVSVQERYWNQILEAYVAYVAVLDATGTNDLKTETLEFDAQIIANKRIYEGRDPGTIFGGHAFLHKVRVLLQSNAPTGNDVVEAIERALDGRKPHELKEDLIKHLDTNETRNQKLKDDLAAAKKNTSDLQELKRDIRTWEENPDNVTEEQQKHLDEYSGNTKLDTLIRKSRAREDDVHGRINNRDNHIRDMKSNLERYQIGSKWRINLADDIVLGVVTKVQSTWREGDPGDPYAPSSIKIHFVINSAVGKVDLPLSRILSSDLIDRSMNYLDRGQMINMFNSNVATTTREIRYVVTGNLIGAYSALTGTGTVFNFSASNGKYYPGILMNRTFTETDFRELDNMPIAIRDNLKAMKYLMSLSKSTDRTLKETGLSDAAQEMRIVPYFGDGMYGRVSWKIYANKPNNYRIGKLIRQDAELRGLIGDFAGSGALVEAQFDTVKLDAVLKRVIEITTLFVPDSGRELLEQATGEKATDKDMISYSFEDGNDENALRDKGDTQTGDAQPDIFDPDSIKPSVTKSKIKKLLFTDIRQMSWAMRNLASRAMNPGKKARGVQDTDSLRVFTAYKEWFGDENGSGFEHIINPKSVARNIKELEKIIGKRIVFYREPGGRSRVGGFINTGRTDTIYLNVGSATAAASIGHELWHTIEHEYPEIAQELTEYLLTSGNMNLEKYKDWLNKQYERAGMNREVTRRVAANETMADLIGDLLMDANAVAEMAGAKPNLFMRLMNAIVAAFNRFLTRTNQSTVYFRDISAANKAAMDALKKVMALKGIEPTDPPTDGGTSPGKEVLMDELSRNDNVPDESHAASIAHQTREGFKDLDAAYKRRMSKLIDSFMATKIGNRIRHYETLGALPNRSEYLIERYRTLGIIGKAEELSDKINKAFRKASPETKEQVYAYFTDKFLSATTINNVAARNNAVKIKKMITAMGQKLVDHGLMTPEAFEEHKGAYLPRLYLKHLMDDQAWSDLGSGKRVSALGYLKKRKDIPEDVRRVILGEIVDPAFLAAVGIGRSMRDIAILDFLDWVSTKEAWIHPNSVIDFEGNRVSIYWLTNEASRLRKMSAFLKPEDAASANLLAARMEREAAAAEKMDGTTIADYKQIPKRYQFGRLAGMWVHRDIHSDMMGVTGYNNRDDMSWIESLLSYGGLGTKITQWWKVSKVALNIPTQARNFISNMVMVNLSGVPINEIPTLFYDAIGQINHGGRAWNTAKEYGVTQSTFANNELRTMHIDLTRIRKENAKDKTELAKLTMQYGAEMVVTFGGNAYQLMESIGKTMIVMHRLEQGDSAAEAALHAHKWLFDYSLVPRPVGYLRNAPMGMPFITFYYKAAPRVIETALMNPLRLLPYALMPFIYSMFMSWANDVDDEDFEKLKKALPEWLNEHEHVYIMPMRDEFGRWVAFDFSYFLPWTMFTTMGKNIAKGDIAQAFSDTNMFGGPVASVISAVRTNIDPFSKKVIIEPNDPPQVKAWNLFKYVWNLSMPTMITELGTLGKTAQALGWDNGKSLDADLRPRNTLSQALIRTIGINLYAIDPEMTRASNIRRMQANISDTMKLAKRRISPPNMSDEDREEVLGQYQIRIDALIEQMIQYEIDSEVHPNLRAKE